MFSSRPLHDRRRAYTLIELLVVVVILITLVAIALPLVSRVLNDSYTREASRQLNSFFAMAKVNAARTGRPYGLFMQCETPVGLTPATTRLRQITKLYLAEVQPPYSGGTFNIRGGFQGTTGAYQFVPVGPTAAEGLAEMQYLGSLIENNEQFMVRFDYKGEWYLCQRSGTQFNWLGNTNAAMGTRNGLGYPLPPNGTTLSYDVAKPFQIVRSPRRVGNPLELTGGTCIDLTYCGIGPAGSGIATPTELANNTKNLCGFVPDDLSVPANVFAVTVMFSAGGGLDEIYVNTSRCTPQGTVHFLVGRVEKVNDPLDPNPDHPSNYNMFDPNKSNLADGTSLWVSVSRSTGTVTTSENVPDLSNTTNQGQFVMSAREIATGREQMGGR